MSAKISDELLKRLKEASKAEPQREIPVIVTITPGADLTALKQKGLKIQQTFENISAVSGTITAAKVNEVALLELVENIEYDGEVQAL